jgi:hypothetical protein
MPHAPNGIIADIRFGDVVQHKGNGCLRNPCMAGNIPTGHSRFVHALVHPLSINQEPSSHAIPKSTCFNPPLSGKKSIRAPIHFLCKGNNDWRGNRIPNEFVCL